MKTDLIEIFQTIRAALQPYAALGFNNRTSSEEKYDLWSEKNLEIDGEKRTETFFVSVSINDDHVALELLPEGLPQHEETMVIKELDEPGMDLIENKVASGYKIFKEQEWV
ncbi:hypothetical protein SAMN06265348_11279 [Pedobacter westerhofensis]|uniref:Uncharacterized protein n=1 Tax=Pedobacter westerhofensis TaxID=425512 RepID=A0A521FGH0_9SPHI|nr:hypothetical protein [Pedobacter westerhofensis]SMO95286.1 hypothetical protein SAMN06265348_11279 [Pedobacter westerhofensis]